MSGKFTGVSLFSGAGGMDTGFEQSGIDVIWANELVEPASQTFAANHPHARLLTGDIRSFYDDLPAAGAADIVFGGPPCQGFSVAGKMDPDDPRSQMIFAFLDVVERVRPLAFVMENVKALGALGKWSEVRERYLERVSELGYACAPFICKATDYGVPQKRERVFFVGIRTDLLPGADDDEKAAFLSEAYGRHLAGRRAEAPTIRELLLDLGPAGTDRNPATCTAKITYTKNPVWRPSPYAGMLFNGSGRPIDLDGWCNTLTASMGGAMTPIVDEERLHGDAERNWVEEYHEEVGQGRARPYDEPVPARMRRITLAEAARIQTFPDSYVWPCSKSATYKQIGNAVPVKLAAAVSSALVSTLEELGAAPAGQGLAD